MTLDTRTDEIRNQELREQEETLCEDLERSHRHDDPSVDAELIPDAVRRRYRESGAFG